MRILRKRKDAQVTDRTVTADGGPPTVAERPWYGPTRALMTLLGVAVAGFLVWLATQISDKSTGGYWAEYGILAGAGLVASSGGSSAESGRQTESRVAQRGQFCLRLS